MKAIIKINLAAFLILLGGCSDFLNLTPESEYSVAGAYKSESDFVQAIAGVYAQQQGLYSSNSSWFRGLIGRSDDTRSNAGYLDGLPRFIESSTNPLLLSSWNNLYRIITLSNIILERIDDGVFTSESTRNYIKGEAYIMRAYSYWNLGWQFGGVPLLERSMTAEEVKTIPRATVEEVFAFAEQDYQTAASMLPDQWTGANAGRATKFAATGMLARMYLFQKKFSEARPLLESIIASGYYAMEEDYRDCFTDSHDNGPERVWEVQFTGGQTGEGQAFSTGLLPEGFNDPSIMPFSGFSTWMEVSQSHYESYEPGDKRRDLSILKGWTNTQGQSDTVTKFIIKYQHYDAYTPLSQSDWANNLPILRYTDVILMQAEVLNELNYTADGEAFELLNAVRRRAGLPALTSGKVPDQAAFRKAIIQERRVELAFEGGRWTDLIRWGIAKEVMNEFLRRPEEGNGLYSMQDFNNLFPIPFEEITRYNDPSVMWQNDGF